MTKLRTLRRGTWGDDVRLLQTSLISLGYNPGPNDGIFGSKTTAAVIQFQQNNGLVPDGIVGPLTWSAIQRQLNTLEIYTIQTGDTFYKIALAKKVPLSELLAVNPGIDPNRLMVGQTIKLPKSTVEAVPIPITIATLGFIPADSVLDLVKPILYMTDNANRRLYAVNYQTKTISFMQFDLAPERLTYAKEKLYIALLKSGHQYYTTSPLEGGIAIVDTKTFTLITQFAINTDPYDIVVDHDGYIYTMPGSNQWEPIDSFTEDGQKVASSGNTRFWSPSEMHPLINRIYSVDTDSSPRDMEYFDVLNGLVQSQKDSPYHGDYNMATNFRLSPDGNYVFNGSGEIFDANLGHVTSLNTKFTDVTFDLANNKFYLGNKAGKGIMVFDYGTDLNRVFKQIGSISTNGYVQNLFFQNNSLIALSKNDPGQYIIEVLNLR
ncbi:hypothetical protein DP73_04180 [Desulfosporosinus sp. HMP52]|uniref:peptidoglycan-binding protein n=1 Tax=Desulfosporosinus sp. HMP52 TaxID=1487923 RepID=UPI00051FD0C4|nr:peptidoglycan-binding protein [Desulfosporosinus sp. HMP52]KGK91326.1 hypothetical protein DP73_04180 [Desulfosporosinus sp. HMP52]